MARYIDKQELIKFLDERGYFKHAIYRSVIEDFPTADVVPTSEVETLRHDIERIIDEGEYWQGKYLVAKQQVAREIFEEIENTLNNKVSELIKDENPNWWLVLHIINNLKKKYTESDGIADVGNT